MTALLLADEHGHELLWSQNRVVQLEDNSLAGKDCLDPTHSNSVLSALSLRWLADIQQPTSVMHCSSLVAADAVLVRRQCRYSDKRV